MEQVLLALACVNMDVLEIAVRMVWLNQLKVDLGIFSVKLDLSMIEAFMDSHCSLIISQYNYLYN